VTLPGGLLPGVGLGVTRGRVGIMQKIVGWRPSGWI